MKLKGCFPALVTPMKSGDPLDFPINHEMMYKLLDYVIKNGVDGVLVGGCTGHMASLAWDEQIELVKKVVDHVNNRVTVIAGDGSNCTREAINAAKKMLDLGIEYHLQISPYQNKPTQEGLYQHYAAIAKAIDSNIIIYNVPGRTGKNVEAETTIRLAKEFSNIIAVKEASGDLEQIKKIIEGTKDLRNFAVLSGDDALTKDIILAGGTGVISVAANVAPGMVSDMVHAAVIGKFKRANKIDDELKELYKILFIETNPGPAHYALRKIGINAGIPRLPLVDVTKNSAEQIDNVLRNLVLIK